MPTVDGPVSVRVPPGIQSGQRLRLRERGVPSRRTGVRGDLVLDVQLVLPPVIDARGRELMQEFARLHPEDVRAGWHARPGGATPDGRLHLRRGFGGQVGEAPLPTDDGKAD